MKNVGVRNPEAGPFGDAFFDVSALVIVEACNMLDMLHRPADIIGSLEGQ